MILQRVSIDNFRCYAGETVFHFLPPVPGEKKNTYLIGGRNGAGKTSFLGALHLCFYGRFESRDGAIRVRQPEDIIECVHGAYEFQGDREAISDFIRQRSNQTVRLAVSYRDENQSDITIERTWKPKQARRGRTSSVLEYQEELAILENGVKLSDWTREDIVGWIEETIPSGTAQFFFFDGEKVDQFADPEKTTHDLKLALERLLGIETYVNLRNHLQQYIVGPIRSESLARLDGERLTTQGQIQTVQAELQTVQTEVAESEKELAGVQSEGQRIKQQLDDLLRREVNIQAREKHRDLAKRRDSLIARDRELKEKSSTFLSETFPYTLIYQELRDLLAESDQLEGTEKVRFVRKTIERLIRRLIDSIQEKNRCPVCNGTTDDFDPVVAQKSLNEHASALLPKEEIETAARLLAPLAADRARSLSQVLKAIQATPTLYSGMIEERADIGRQIESLDQKVEDLEVSPEAKTRYDRLLIQHRNNGAEEQRLSDALEGRRVTATKKESEINDLHRKLDNLEDQRKVQELEQRVLSVARKSQAVLDEFVETLRIQRLDALENEATKVFQTLLSSAAYNAHKASIRFDRSNNGYRPIPYLEDSPKDARSISRGIQQLFALALLGGLCKSAQTSMPLVIDTPLSGLDDRNKQCVLNSFFPEAAEQVILLARPDEIGAQDVEGLKTHIVQTFLLDFDPSGHSTYVREHEYF